MKFIGSHKREEIAYFVGIGGIGVSALAQWYQSEGWEVFGSDAARSIVTDELKKRGIRVHIGGQTGKWVPKGASLLIYSAAVAKDHPERRRAARLSIRQLSYAEALGELTKRYKTIAIAGAHGKSTTTAMVSLMLIGAGFDPTVIVGTRVKEFGGTNFRRGKSEWLVIEADEYHHSFLEYRPYAAIVTNIDREHLEYYKSFSNIKKAFKKFIRHVEPGGFIAANGDDAALTSLKLAAPAKVIWYHSRGGASKKLKSVLRVPGAHNLSNALACNKLGKLLGINAAVRLKALANFRGTWRRFEFKGTFRGARVYDDYGHHPTEIRATLAGARDCFPKSQIICVFQPPHSDRLRLLFNEFISSFNDADRIILAETYKVKGREGRDDPGRNAKALAAGLSGRGLKATYAPNHRSALQLLRHEVKKGNIILCMGAGDIWKISQQLLKI